LQWLELDLTAGVSKDQFFGQDSYPIGGF